MEGSSTTAACRRSPESLERFYARAAAFSPDSHPELFPSEAERLAYWINVYNAGVLKLVVTYYPVSSVKQVRPPLLLFFLPDLSGFFYFRKLIFGGAKTNLYDLEHDIVRGRFAEPRIHFALNCASRGCPRLPRTAFHPETLDDELSREARRFFGETRNLRIDHAGQKVLLSQILEWYESDFTDWLREQRPERPATLLEYVALHVDTPSRPSYGGARPGIGSSSCPTTGR